MPESHEGEEGARWDEGQVVLAQVQVHQVQHALEGSERGKPGLDLNPQHISKLYSTVSRLFSPCNGREIRTFYSPN